MGDPLVGPLGSRAEGAMPVPLCGQSQPPSPHLSPGLTDGAGTSFLTRGLRSRSLCRWPVCPGWPELIITLGEAGQVLIPIG